MSIDELEPYVKYEGESYIYINKKGQMYLIRPLNEKSRDKDIWVHGSKLEQDDELNAERARKFHERNIK